MAKLQKYLRKLGTNEVFIYTDLLFVRGDMTVLHAKDFKAAKAMAKAQAAADARLENQIAKEVQDEQVGVEMDLDDNDNPDDDGTDDPVAEMEADELEIFARNNFGKELDKRLKVETLRDQVREMIAADAGE